jgi:hypothetical protein
MQERKEQKTRPPGDPPLLRRNGKIGSGSRSGEVFSFSCFYSSFFFPRYFDRKESSAAS